MRVGILGGTFDPPHMGHLVLAQDAVEALALDRLYWVPARRSPFKEPGVGTDADIRAELVDVAVRGHPAFRVWRGELERPEPSYTVDTVRAFRERFPGGELVLLLGTDQWRSFGQWKDPDRIADQARICVLDRRDPGDVRAREDDGAGDGEFQVIRLTSRRMDVSSTEIRQRARQGRSIRYLVTDAVRRKIEELGLYVGAGTAAPADRPS